jgi:hypothetical protein
MPIIPLLQGSAFGPEEIKLMATAFQGALNALGLMDRADPLNELVAKKVIEIAPKQGSVILADYGTALLNHCKARCRPELASLVRCPKRVRF